MISTLMRIIQLDEDASVAFFPSDHYYCAEGKFTAGVMSALQVAEADARSVILLGAPAKHPEVDYGWIEPADGSGNPLLLRVRRFWEKPSHEVAQDLLERGCLWNTFVMIGRAHAFLEMIRSAAADLYRAFESLLAEHRLEAHMETMTAIYDRLDTADFAKQILSPSADRLAVLRLGDIGWSDLGDPHRVLTALSRSGVETPWAKLWHRDAAAVGAPG
jgi:mannose-1-phosphate guanylyltransferase